MQRPVGGVGSDGRRRSAAAAALILLTLLFATGVTLPADASPTSACASPDTAQLFVPTGTSSPPFVATSSMSGVLFYISNKMTPGHYHLEATGGTVNIGGAHFPDFNVAWFKDDTPFDKQVGYHDDAGDQVGTAPAEFDYALVYMRYGPDPASDGSLGAGFRLYSDCPGP